MPSVVVLWGQTLNGNRTTIKLLRKIRIAEQFLQSETIPFDPVFGRQIDGGICRQSAVCHATYNLLVFRLVNRSCIRPELAAKELIEVLVLCRIRLFQLTECFLQVEALSKLSDSDSVAKIQIHFEVAEPACDEDSLR